MKRSHLAILSLVAAAWCAPIVGGADVPLSPRRGVLMLGNGELIEGTITAAGDRYDVDLPDGQVRVRRSQVALVARDVHECYLHRRAEVEAGSVQDNIELVEWCLRHGLIDEAQRETAAAKAIDPTHPRIPLLETRLRLARNKPTAAAPSAPSRRATGSAPQKPSKRPLDLMVRNLPVGSVETFTKNIQPLLLNYCAGSGCHASKSAGAMRLERIPPNRFTGRKSTQRNLQSVLATIDRNNPLSSKLLTVPIEPHGGSKQPAFGNREQSQYRQLVAWVYHVAGSIQPPRKPTLEERTAPLLEQGPSAAVVLDDDAGTNGDRPPADAVDSSQSRAVDPSQSSPDKATDGRSTGSNKGLPTRMPEDVPPAVGSKNAAAQRERQAQRFVPKDSFDPEIFNRRFFGK